MTIVGRAGSFVEIESEAVREPARVGENVTDRVHELIGAIGCAQPPTPKSVECNPETPAVRLSGKAPVLATTTLRGAVVRPTRPAPKSTLTGVTFAAATPSTTLTSLFVVEAGSALSTGRA